MYLSNIELFGFKSFAHRVKIQFDKGLTAIVGPNGCGKTNVVDAIRWVLGEQKSSLLRSTKMENIIFNGSRQLKPLSMSEVSITIENTRNILPTEYTEITVTRRLYRSGDSDYLLNQVPCRLKDILDLFADTGMGSDAYSVIELKMIEEIISNKSEERLKLFEEAAGITRYKHRRKQTFRQLESTTRDLERVDDVLAEVSKKVRSLKTQVKKAEQYRELKTSFRELDLALSALGLAEMRNTLCPRKAEIARQEKIVQETATEIAGQDSSLQESELRQLGQERDLSEAQKILNEKNQEVHSQEKKLLQLREQEKNCNENISRIAESISEKKRRASELEKNEKRLSEQLAPLEREGSARERELQAVRKELETLETLLAESRKEQHEAGERISEHQRSLSALHIDRQKLETTRDHLQGALSRLTSRRNELRLAAESALPSRKTVEERISAQKSLIETAKEEIDDLKQLRRNLDEAREARKERLLELRSNHDRLRNRILLADSILDNYEGLPEGIAWLENGSGRRHGFGCLSDLVSTDEIHRKAVNAAFGEKLGYYICSTLQEAKEGIRSLSNAGKGKVHFLVLDLLRRSGDTNYPEIGMARKITSVLDVPGELGNAVAMFMQHCYIVEDLQTAETLALKHPGCTFVTPSGEKFGDSGVLFGGGAVDNEGLRLGKKAERKRLRTEERNLQEKIAREEKELCALSARLEALPLEEKEKTHAALDKALREHEQHLDRLNIEETSRRGDLETIEREIAEAGERLRKTTVQLDALRPRLSEEEQKSGELRSSLLDARERVAERENEHNRLNRETQLAGNRYKDATLELEKLRLRISSCGDNKRSLLQDAERMELEIETARTSLGTFGKRITEAESDLEKLLVESGTDQQRLTEMETAYNECRLANQERRDRLRELRRRHEVEIQLRDELQHRIAGIERSIDNLLTSVGTRYGCDLEDVEPDTPENFDREEAESRLEGMREKLDRFGAVNELALEEYETEQERLDFLTSQKEDLLEAETQLRSTIDEINKTALKKFEETFNAVRGNFIRIFRELFEETDEADLLITTEDDPLEARIEILARPRGKKPLSIEQLSGGEKALTALALLFSIYLVKPSPFCILDEVDAPLDDANIGRFIRLLKKFENNTQFIIVTHNKKTMASSQALYGVTMEEEGVSKLIPVKLGKEETEQLSGTDA
ncbi:chromosome segregation protein SMC [Prosthecochloris sp. GSB1]|uniref:chromosome segregation protein SMC n=1 Tax=Prosthecochloris sp. GSB1 TaxID=281093 RepID=UPI000B8CEA93|nr:chromosome segregation protein SMC [Prosthecochloris sp. GSB1]ASQ91100.1 chromosome segregation protein SMC [Prosthecochloris sp. GSB1]